MATFFIDYQQLILDAYERKKKENTLPYGLMHLTPANLKEECLKRCTKDMSKRDEKVIRDFCTGANEPIGGKMGDPKDCYELLQDYDINKFKPLVNFIKGSSQNTVAKNIELLAMLLDFPGRPWDSRKTYPVEGFETPDTNEDEPETGKMITEAHFLTHQPVNEIEIPAESPGIPEIPEIPMALMGTSGAENSPAGKEKSKGKSTKRLAVAAILSLALGTSGMWLWKETSQPMDLSGGCMIWRDDHYEPIACGEKVEGALIIGLDSVKLKNFRKITTPDTITYRAMGKVWYSKIDGKIEFFTSEGLHPVNINRKLKPLSTYMIDKYILSGTASN